MNRQNSAREAMLGRIRDALQDVPPGESLAAAARDYQRQGTSEHKEVLERFIERVADYKVTVRQVAERELPEAIAAACAARNVRRLVAPADLPETWPPAGVELWRDDPPLTNEQLDQSDGVLTGCALGIAQTGTIVLDGGSSQGRRILTLLPDYHLCVIFETQIVDLVPEAIIRLADAVRLRQQPVTFISGPSATSDIELNRVEGVHGPRTLDVLVVQPISRMAKEKERAPAPSGNKL